MDHPNLYPEESKKCSCCASHSKEVPKILKWTDEGPKVFSYNSGHHREIREKTTKMVQHNGVAVYYVNGKKVSKSEYEANL